MIGPTDLLHPYPAPHFVTFKVFLVYFPKCPIFSTLQSCAFKQHFIRFFPKFRSNLYYYDYKIKEGAIGRTCGTHEKAYWVLGGKSLGKRELGKPSSRWQNTMNLLTSALAIVTKLRQVVILTSPRFTTIYRGG